MRQTLKKELQKGSLRHQAIPAQPALVRICHWGFALSMAGLLLTGFELHQPAHFLAFQFGQEYIIHLTFSWLSMAFFMLRVTDAIFRKDRSILVGFKDIKNFPKLLSYYLFLRSSPPPAGKYNSGQKLFFTSWLVLFILGSILGLASYDQGEHLAWIVRLTGGWQMLRWAKYAIAIYFGATISVHIYLSLTEDLSRLQAMITGFEDKFEHAKTR